MPARVLVILLSLCGAFAIYPTLVWGVATLFAAVDDRWRDVLGHLAFTLPMALAAAAIILTVHGLRLNALFQEEAFEEYEQLREQQLRAAAAATAATAAATDEAGAASGVATVTAQTPHTSRGAPKEGRDPSDTTQQRGDRKRPTASRGRRMSRRVQSMARRQLRRKSGF